VLRESLRTGQWRSVLPPERSLAEEIRVSRPVLRRALHLLAEEGLIAIRPGQPARILAARPAGSKRARPARRVALLSGQPLQAVGSWHLLVIDALRRHLHTLGYSLEFVSDLRLRWNNAQPALAKIVRQHQADCWILLSQPFLVQQWFQTQRVDAITLGSPFPGMRLSSVDEDYRAMCRHAVGVFLGAGHRQIVFLRRKTAAAGDAESEAGFRAAFQHASAAGLTPCMARHDGTPENVCAHLRSLLSAARPPTALLVSHAEDALTVLTYLRQQGIAVPDQVSLISRHDADFLERVIPPMARYKTDSLKTARALCQLVDATLTRGARVRAVRNVPSFYPGSTVAPPPR
jgi:LacI family transcriptional regulator